MLALRGLGGEGMMQTSSHNLSCFISSHTTSFKPSTFLNEFAVAGPKPA
jgi:hypothetical protein